jgi:hypothetical protein
MADKKQKFALYLGGIPDRQRFDALVAEIKDKGGQFEGKPLNRWVIDLSPYDGLLDRKGVQRCEELPLDYEVKPREQQ